MTSRGCKTKGKNFQNKICDMISKLIGLPVEKDGELESRQMGMTGVDIILRGRARKFFPYSVEAKRCEQLSIYRVIQQAEKNIMPDTEPCIIFQKNHKESWTCVRTTHFFELLEKIK